MRAKPSRAQWRKSTRRSGNGQCVEVAQPGRIVAVRDSKNPDGPKLGPHATSGRAFIHCVKCEDSIGSQQPAGGRHRAADQATMALVRLAGVSGAVIADVGRCPEIVLVGE